MEKNTNRTAVARWQLARRFWATFLLGGAMCCSAAEIVSNGSFEAVENGKAKGWSLPAYYSCAPGMGRNGTAAIAYSFVTNRHLLAPVAQPLSLEPSETYRVSCWVRTEGVKPPKGEPGTKIGVEVYVADLIAIGLFRELGPLITAIILAGRSGSAFAAEIGAMKVNEEIDALTTMGLPPVGFLVLPRIVAVTLAMPFLTVAAEVAGLVGGAIVLSIMGVPTVVFWSHVIASTACYVFLMGLAKAALFGWLVGLVGCICGLRTRNTADGVGVAATSAVVGGIVAVAVTDGLLAVICFIFDI